MEREGPVSDAIVSKEPSSSDVAGNAFAIRAIDRMEQLLENETRALRSRSAIDLRHFNERKSHAMLELSRVVQLLGDADHEGSMAARLRGLRAKLEENRAVLRIHVDAVREVSAIISQAIRESESDGTYSRSACGTGKG